MSVILKNSFRHKVENDLGNLCGARNRVGMSDAMFFSKLTFTISGYIANPHLYNCDTTFIADAMAEALRKVGYKVEKPD